MSTLGDEVRKAAEGMASRPDPHVAGCECPRCMADAVARRSWAAAGVGPEPAPECDHTEHCDDKCTLRPQPEGVNLRPGEPSDWPFIADSWRRNYLGADKLGRADQERRCWQGAAVGRCLSNSEVLVAHPLGRAEQILGWVCFRRPSVIHYVYVKPYYRRHGIGKALLREALVKPDQHDPFATWAVAETSHWWQGREAICTIIVAWQRAGGRLYYNPALIFGGTT